MQTSVSSYSSTSITFDFEFYLWNLLPSSRNSNSLIGSPSPLSSLSSLVSRLLILTLKTPTAALAYSKKIGLLGYHGRKKIEISSKWKSRLVVLINNALLIYKDESVLGILINERHQNRKLLFFLWQTTHSQSEISHQSFDILLNFHQFSQDTISVSYLFRNLFPGRKHYKQWCLNFVLQRKGQNCTLQYL